MSVGRILTQGFGAFGGRKYLPTMGLGSFAVEPEIAVGTSVAEFRSRSVTVSNRSRSAVAAFRSRTAVARGRK